MVKWGDGLGPPSDGEGEDDGGGEGGGGASTVEVHLPQPQGTGDQGRGGGHSGRGGLSRVEVKVEREGVGGRPMAARAERQVGVEGGGRGKFLKGGELKEEGVGGV